MKTLILSIILLFNVQGIYSSYTKIQDGKKCPKDNTRLFKIDPVSGIDECFNACNDDPRCYHFNFGTGGNGNLMCMGCNGHETSFGSESGFDVYEMENREYIGPVAATAAAVVLEGAFTRILEQKKCRKDSTRLFKIEKVSNQSPDGIAECYQACQNFPSCHHFSYGTGQNGDYMCMGCNGHEHGFEDDASDDSFDVYELENVRDWQYTMVASGKKCPDFFTVGGIDSTTRDECWNACKDTAACNFFTFDDDALATGANSGKCTMCAVGDGLETDKNQNTYSILSPAEYRPVCSGNTAFVWGDPHFGTFDGVKYDCQGKGEFVLAMSTKPDDPLQIHGRFVGINNGNGPSVTRSLAIKVDENVPVLRVTVPDLPDENGECPYSYTIGADEIVVPSDEIVEYFLNNYAGQANVYTSSTAIIATYPDYGARVEILVHAHQFTKFGCRLRLNLCLTPEKHGGASNIVGMFGTPNGDPSDDWMSSDPNVGSLPIPSDHRSRVSEGHHYCLENWCVTDEKHSMYNSDTFNQYNKCPYDSFNPEELEAMLDALPQEVQDACAQTSNPEECVTDVVLATVGTDENPLDLVEGLLQEEHEQQVVMNTTEAELHAEEVWTSPNVTVLRTLATQTSNMVIYDDATPNAPSGSQGDPHFKTWKNEHFEYHGQCDMILVKDADFADGLGLEVQIRTKLVRFWSYIASAAIRIGDDVLEIRGSADPEAMEPIYWFNLEYQGLLEGGIGGFPISMKKATTKTHKHSFLIDLSSKYPGQSISLSSWKEFIKVSFNGGNELSYGNSVGMLGDFKTGKTLARDGITEIDSFSVLGNEWQVLPSDHMLFRDSADPQFPKKCIEPEDPRGERKRRRRLGEEAVSEEVAEAACSRIADPLDRKDCVYDILATQDLDMVGAY